MIRWWRTPLYPANVVQQTLRTLDTLVGLPPDGCHCHFFLSFVGSYSGFSLAQWTCGGFRTNRFDCLPSLFLLSKLPAVVGVFGAGKGSLFQCSSTISV